MKRDDMLNIVSPCAAVPFDVAAYTRSQLPRLDSDRLAWLDAHKVYMQFDSGPFEGWGIACNERGWVVGKGVKVRYESTLREAIDAIMDDRELDEFADGSVDPRDLQCEPDLERE